MISAVEALRLARVELPADERKVVETILADLDKFIHANMEFRGLQYVIPHPSGNVLGKIITALRAEKWEVVAEPKFETSRFNRAAQTLVGYVITLIPSQAAYQEADRKIEIQH